MSREPRLRPVDRAAGDGAAGTETPAAPHGADAEVQSCRELVRAAASPTELAEVDHELLLALTLGEGVSVLSPADAQRAARLAEALATELGSDARRGPQARGAAAHGAFDPELRGLLELAAAVHAASGSGSLDEISNERLLGQAMARAERARPRSSRRWALLGSAAAVAAGIAIFVASFAGRDPNRGVVSSRGTPPAGVHAAVLQLIPARSTEALFDPAEKFPVRGGESARVDKIASARAVELRANRFASWGVP